MDYAIDLQAPHYLTMETGQDVVNTLWDEINDEYHTLVEDYMTCAGMSENSELTSEKETELALMAIQTVYERVFGDIDEYVSMVSSCEVSSE